MTPQSDGGNMKSPETANLEVPKSAFLGRNPNPFSVGATPLGGSEQRQFIICDHSGNHTTFMFSSVAPTLHAQCPGPQLQGPIEVVRSDVPSSTGVVDCSSLSGKETPAGEKMDDEEDADDDIDALLNSESDEFEEGWWSDQFPHINSDSVQLEEEVASCGGPPKRTRPWEEEAEECDTAGSGQAVCEDDEGWSCVNGGGGREDGWGRDGKRMRRDRIEEAVCVLRKIIPGCGGKADAVVVLEEAIQYLKSLELKAKSLGIPI